MLKGEKERRKVCEGILKVCESDKKYFESVRNDILNKQQLTCLKVKTEEQNWVYKSESSFV